MAERRSPKDEQRKRLEHLIHNGQIPLMDILFRYKTENVAIKHLAIYNLHGNLLAFTPDDEAQNPRLLRAQYEWLAQIIGPAITSMNDAHTEFTKYSHKPVSRAFGRPKALRLQTADGTAVTQIYAAPIDLDALIFVVATARADNRRNAYVVNENLLLEDIEELIGEIENFIGTDHVSEPTEMTDPADAEGTVDTRVREMTAKQGGVFRLLPYRRA